MSLENIRKKLDVIDEQIVKLYEERMQLCEEVGIDKVKTGKKVYDKQRENEKLAVLTSKASNEFNRRGIKELFEQIMSMSRKRQYQILGNHGVFGMQDLFFKEWKEPIVKRRFSSFLEIIRTYFM